MQRYFEKLPSRVIGHADLIIAEQTATFIMCGAEGPSRTQLRSWPGGS
jgi:hypothetical protein